MQKTMGATKKQIYAACMDVVYVIPPKRDSFEFDSEIKEVLKTHSQVGSKIIVTEAGSWTYGLGVALAQVILALGKLNKEILDEITLDSISIAADLVQENGTGALGELFEGNNLNKIDLDKLDDFEREYTAGFVTLLVTAEQIIKDLYGDFLTDEGNLVDVPSLKEEQAKIKADIEQAKKAKKPKQKQDKEHNKQYALTEFILQAAKDNAGELILKRADTTSGTPATFTYFPNIAKAVDSRTMKYSGEDILTLIQKFQEFGFKYNIIVHNDTIALQAELD